MALYAYTKKSLHVNSTIHCKLTIYTYRLYIHHIIIMSLSELIDNGTKDKPLDHYIKCTQCNILKGDMQCFPILHVR